MGTNNKQRRAAKRRARAAGQARPTPPRPGGADGTGYDQVAAPGERFAFGQAQPAPSPAELAGDLVQAAADAVANAEALDDAVRDLVVFAGTHARDDPSVAARVATAVLLERLSTLYENGWQPADVMHVLRSRLGTRFVAPVAGIVLQHAQQQRASARAPQFWVDQLSMLTDVPLADLPARPHWTVLDEWRRVNAWDSWHDVAALIRHLQDHYPMRRIAPPPSSWPTRRAAPTDRAAGAGGRPTVAAGAGHDPKKLAIIRALLAKAEATDFAEEADAFTAKAQDLMTRYAIDEALLADTAERVEVLSRRVHVDNPYAPAKAQLLATVSQVNRVKAIWDDEHAIATVVGVAVDLDLAEMLFTSLLVQATKAMTEAGSASVAGHRLDRSPKFRRAFLLAYADRIGERLVDAGSHAQQEESRQRGREVLPVLARRSAEVDREFDRLFPDSRQGRATRVDARGWQAGRAAADRAVLVSGQVADRPA